MSILKGDRHFSFCWHVIRYIYLAGNIPTWLGYILNLTVIVDYHTAAVAVLPFLVKSTVFATQVRMWIYVDTTKK